LHPTTTEQLLLQHQVQANNSCVKKFSCIMGMRMYTPPQPNSAFALNDHDAEHSVKPKQACLYFNAAALWCVLRKD
jgi:hypothetical protein